MSAGIAIRRWTWEATPETASAARRALRRTLSLASPVLPEDVIADIVLAACELVTNAVLHGSGPIRVTLAIARGAIWFQVRDNSPIPADRKRRRVHSGRGLAIVQELTDVLGVTKQGPGKVVWFIKNTNKEAA